MKHRRQINVFDEEKEGTKPCFVLEITSKATARLDRKSKPSIYRKAGVEEIFLLDRLKSPWVLSGKRRNPATSRYLNIRADKRGRLLAETLGVYFSLSASGDDLILEDAATGEVLRKPVAESRARRAAERQAAEEAEAREAAERQAAEEAEGREAAEKRVEQGLRQSVKDLCAVLGLAWDTEKSARIERMSASQLEVLRAHVVQEKNWPESFLAR
jgi:hypothetical protein